jgi:RNA polymerase sigma-70 factor (ECF subfamily)
VSSIAAETELRLLTRARSPSPSERAHAFRELFDALRIQVYAVCLQIAGGKSEADDAVQDCFLAVHQALPAFRGDSRLSTWVYRIAIRSALAVKARRPRRQAPLDEAAHVSSPERNPEELAHARREIGRLEDALSQLSDEHRIVLALFAVEGLGHAEIARILGVPPGTIWSRLHVARKRLASILGGSFGSDSS